MRQGGSGSDFAREAGGGSWLEGAGLVKIPGVYR